MLRFITWGAMASAVLLAVLDPVTSTLLAAGCLACTFRGSRKGRHRAMQAAVWLGVASWSGLLLETAPTPLALYLGVLSLGLQCLFLLLWGYSFVAVKEYD